MNNKLMRSTFCSISNCATNTKNRRSGLNITFHPFPKLRNCTVPIRNENGEIIHLDLRKAWQMRTHIDDNDDSTEICSEHFQPEDFVGYLRGVRRWANVRTLKEDAVPSLNLPPPLTEDNNTPLTKNDELETEKKITKNILSLKSAMTISKLGNTVVVKRNDTGKSPITQKLILQNNEKLCISHLDQLKKKKQIMISPNELYGKTITVEMPNETTDGNEKPNITLKRKRPNAGSNQREERAVIRVLKSKKIPLKIYSRRKRSLIESKKEDDKSNVIQQQPFETVLLTEDNLPKETSTKKIGVLKEMIDSLNNNVQQYKVKVDRFLKEMEESKRELDSEFSKISSTVDQLNIFCNNMLSNNNSV